MKKIFSLLVLLTCYLQVLISQSFFNSLNLDLRYPITIGENFMNSKDLGSGYQSIVDAGIGLNIFEVRRLSTGLSFNTSILRLPLTDLTATGLTPKLFIAYNLYDGRISLVPAVSFGYSWWRYKTVDFIAKDRGFNFESSMKLIFNSRHKFNFYISGAWGFTRLIKPEGGAMDSDFNRNISVIYPGIGMRLSL